MKRQPKSKRGGARPGAGRKPLGVVALHCYPKAETVQRIRFQAQATGRSIGQVIDALKATLPEQK